MENSDPNLFLVMSQKSKTALLVLMKPVSMELGQSAVFAGDLSLAENCTVQDLPFHLLHKKLIAVGRMLCLALAVNVFNEIV